MKYLRKIKTLYNILKIRLKERSYGGGKFVFYGKNSDSLLICFSAFPPTNLRLYNNIRGFSMLNVDRLYIADIWGIRGTYYLRENGGDEPYRITNSIIEKFLKIGHYRKVYTAGTSKGGAAAILFGLKYNVDAVFAGACQYRLGNWLNSPVHTKIINGMRGSIKKEKFVEEMNNLLPSLIQDNDGSETVVHLVYSKLEDTYDNHIKELIYDLRKHHITVVEKECIFENHNDVGYHFIPYVKEYFNANEDN